MFYSNASIVPITYPTTIIIVNYGDGAAPANYSDGAPGEPQ